MTWAINEGYPYLPDRQAVLEFISNIGQVLSPPAIPQPLQARPPTNPYPDDLLPLIQQLAWKLSETPSRDPSVAKFLSTVGHYLGRPVDPGKVQQFSKPMFPPLPPALYSLPLNELPALCQVAYWLMNEGSPADDGNPHAWTFVAFLSQRVKGRGGIPVSKPVFHSRNEPLEEQYAAVEADGVSEHDRAE
jgi:hypothetical protein